MSSIIVDEILVIEFLSNAFFMLFFLYSKLLILVFIVVPAR